MQNPESPTTRQCGHLYPAMVSVAQGGRRARCLNCGATGPARAGLGEAMRALRDEGNQDPENAMGGEATRSYVTNSKKGRVGSPARTGRSP